jgi:hypothetical protein
MRAPKPTGAVFSLWRYGMIMIDYEAERRAAYAAAIRSGT